MAVVVVEVMIMNQSFIMMCATNNNCDDDKNIQHVYTTDQFPNTTTSIFECHPAIFITYSSRYFAIGTNFAKQQAAVTYIYTQNVSSAITVLTPNLFHALACAPGNSSAGATF